MESRGTIYLPEEKLELPFELVKIKGGNTKHVITREFVEKKRLAFIGKRIFDLCFSSFVILFILTWLIPLIALFIKIDSKGPIFFLQKRVGRHGFNFTCFKFRTMITHENNGTMKLDRSDFYITRFGRFLRQSNLDELPQFFNVWLGSMSVVGPRPHMYSDCKRFSFVIPNYDNRNLIKPGITGLAQVKGYHGPVSDPVSIFRRYQWDMVYVKKFSLLLDISIICKTAWQRLSWLVLRFF